ncbi:bifunctional phosphopantothenoylcysteine decarboxylase/phosphopantothenate--cysteine ligase CoaBC [Litorivicinus lipolyticus]|uniref:bifunctional phosphopantothenoylcysteine decarboxylase/phosphopantothenate--cysteine ligase CoaBC n=1 Tax=Litorivicinus lipolyticus TaxID=418701 RepID=UPI003B5CFFEE
MTQVLSQRRVILGITGGIAAYKAAELVRTLVRAGAQVQVVMTEAAQAFVTPLTLQALSGREVKTTLLDPSAEAGMGHIELARWAELLLIAPCTADTMARLAQGRGDDLLTTLTLATAAPVHIAPAMNQQMWAQASTQANLATLLARGIQVHGPDAGEQACGDVGLGRMLEPAALHQAVERALVSGQLAGQHWLVSAGPTREAIDPVRYVSNHSSGKMGYAIAAALRDAGAQVTLVSGPTTLDCPDGIERVAVNSALEMLAACQAVNPDGFIACAAVADFRPAMAAEHKLKKGQGDLNDVHWVENPDIVAAVAGAERRPRWVIGFAAETENAIDNARAKRIRKGLDAILANTVGDNQAFGTDDNHLHWIDAHGDTDLGHAPKRVLAEALVRRIIDLAKE